MASAECKQIRATLVRDVPTDVPIPVQRQEWEAAVLQAEVLPGTVIEADNSDGIPCEWVRVGAVDQRKVFLFVHGGGFNSGSSKTHRELASRLSKAAGISVLLPNYRLAPEDPFPAGLDDVIGSYRWLIGKGWSPQNIVIGGDSAGANLALASLLSMRDAGDKLPSACVLISAWLDLTHSGETMTTNAGIDPLTTCESLQAAAELYATGNDRSERLISPVFSNLHGLPPMLLQVASDEILLSDSTRFAEKARAAGVDVQLDVWADMWHVWHGCAAVLPEGREAIEAIGQYVKRTLQVVEG